MLDNFIFSINCVLPLFIILAVGFLLRNVGIIDNNAVNKMNSVVFSAALPTMLFRDIAECNFMDFFDLKLVIFSVITTIIIYFLLLAISTLFFKERKKAGSFIQGSFRGNFVILGLPLLNNILGSHSGMALLITAFTVPLYNVLSVVALSYGASIKGQGFKAVGSAFKNIIKNPIIIGILAGIPFSLFKVEFPIFIKSSLNYMAELTTPLALIAIGASLTLDKVKKEIKGSLLASAMKLVIMPVIFLKFAYRFGFTGEAFVILYIMYAAPSAVSTYIMASNMNNDADLAANIVMVTTLLSVLTFTIGIYVIKTLGII